MAAASPASSSAGATGGAAMWALQAARGASAEKHSLYRFDAKTQELTLVGDFGGCDFRVLDVAMDESGRLFASTVTSWL